MRCIGLGECRKHDSGSMCPSYMVTLEEEHSTRGRAHMLFEVLQGEVVNGGWKDEHVKTDARSVPFLQGLQIGMPDQRGHGHVQGGISLALLRKKAPPAAHAYAFGMIDRWAELGSHCAAPRQLFQQRAGLPPDPAGASCIWRRSGACRSLLAPRFREWASRNEVPGSLERFRRRPRPQRKGAT